MRLSVIIPMYNAEPFIAKCVGSVLEEIHDPGFAEIIVVDDGSVDSGASVVSDLMKDHSNISLIKQSNAGQSVARNNGLKSASGEFVWFVDADDWILPGSVGKIFDAIDRVHADGQVLDMYAFGMDNIDDQDGKVQSTFRYDGELLCSGREFVIRKNESLKLCAPLYVYRREFLISNGIFFPEGIFHEDAEFIPKSVYQAGCIKTTSDVYYGRLLHSASLTHSPNVRRIKGILEVLRLNYSFMQNEIKDRTCKKAFCSLISNIANYGCRIASSMGKEVESEYNTGISAYPWLGDVLRRSSKLKYRIEGWILAIFPGRFAAVHDFLMIFK